MIPLSLFITTLKPKPVITQHDRDLKYAPSGNSSVLLVFIDRLWLFSRELPIPSPMPWMYTSIMITVLVAHLEILL